MISLFLDRSLPKSHFGSERATESGPVRGEGWERVLGQCVTTQSAILARAALQWFLNTLRHLSDSPPASSLQTTQTATWLTDWQRETCPACKSSTTSFSILLPHISNVWITTGVFNVFWRTISKYLMDVFLRCYCAGTANPQCTPWEMCVYFILPKICYMKYLFISGYLIICSISKQLFTNMMNVLAKIF